jgi:sugar phosphate permease
MANINETPGEPASQVRWLMFSLACGTSWFLYLHRYAWNIVGPKIQETYQFDNTQSGFVFSLFYWTYAAGQIPSGIAIDLFGPHLFLGTSIILWSIALIGFGLTGNLPTIGGLRLLFGAAQAGCYPGLTKATRVWFPLRNRTTVQGWIATTFGRAGGAMSPIILGTVLMGWCGLSWQSALGAMGLAGIAFGLTFLVLFRNSPAEHPRVNEAEREEISEGATAQSLKGTLPWSRAFRSRSLFCFTLQQLMDAGSDVVFVYLIGKYFLDGHGLKIESVGWLTSLPLWGGALGGIAGGWLNDRLIRTSGNRRWARSGIGFVGKVIGSIMLLLASIQSGPVAAGIALMLAKFFSDWSQPTVWGTCTDLGGRCSATVFSIINTAGTIGGVVMPIALGVLLDWNTIKLNVGGVESTKTDWAPLFLVLASMYLASAIFWLLIDCTQSLDTGDDTA